jgi:mRNA interferase MazF
LRPARVRSRRSLDPSPSFKNELFVRTASITICPITTVLADAGVIRLPLEPSADTGLRTDSWIMVDKVTTISRASLGREIGSLSEHQQSALDQALRLFLALD